MLSVWTFWTTAFGLIVVGLLLYLVRLVRGHGDRLERGAGSFFILGLVVGLLSVIYVISGQKPVRAEIPTQPVSEAKPTAVPATLSPVSTPTLVAPLPPAPQTQVRHPSWYEETGVGRTKTWNVEVPEGATLIIGGFAVDDIKGGVYKAWAGPAKVTVTVTDGFGLVIKNDWAKQEFEFRVAQAKTNNWAHNTVQPLPTW